VRRTGERAAGRKRGHERSPRAAADAAAEEEAIVAAAGGEIRGDSRRGERREGDGQTAQNGASPRGRDTTRGGEVMWAGTVVVVGSRRKLTRREGRTRGVEVDGTVRWSCLDFVLLTFLLLLGSGTGSRRVFLLRIQNHLPSASELLAIWNRIVTLHEIAFVNDNRQKGAILKLIFRLQGIILTNHVACML
jgi:hypothetical protein